jgi:hypothetical protein
MIATVKHHIMLQLVRANPFEALILNELGRRPTARQEEWLRSLLVQGFQCECRALQVIEAREHRTPAADVPSEAQAPRPALAAVNGVPVSAPLSVEASDAGDAPTAVPLSLAALQQVIG